MKRTGPDMFRHSGQVLMHPGQALRFGTTVWRHGQALRSCTLPGLSITNLHLSCSLCEMCLCGINSRY